MRLERSRTSWRRVATVVFVVIATLAAFLVAGTAPAQARINSEIVFTDAVLKHVDQSGNPVADQTTLPLLLTNNATRTTGESPVPPAPNPGNPDPTDPADPGESDPVDPSESAKAPKTVPTPMRPGLPRTGHEG